MNQSTRIELTDNTMSAIMKMSGGNPGAVTVCVSLVKDGGQIDPDAWAEGFTNVFSLDTLGIYEHRIWMLYKDVCGESLVKMIALLRAVQLGKMSESALNHAIDNRGRGIDVDEALKQVMEELPNFNKVQVQS